MYDYNTLSEAVDDLQQRGYDYNFNLLENGLNCESLKKRFEPQQFNVVETYRFEGMSSTDDASVVYAIETSDGTKGILVDAYGVYADSLSPEMLQKLMK